MWTIRRFLFATNSQSIDTFKAMLPEAIEGGLTPVMLKEMVYQAVDYLGFGRVYPFLSGGDEHGEIRRPHL